DTLNNRIQANVGASANGWSVFISAGTTVGTVNSPRGVTVAASGNVFIGDTGNNRIQRKSPTTNNVTVVGIPGTTSGQFNVPSGVR
ncbi:MAG: periplasmic copper-binding protein, partial [bacterium]